MKSTSSHDNLARVLFDAGQNALKHGTEAGEVLVRQNWPHLKPKRTKRTISERQKLLVFIADGFRCRYTGDLLVLPAYLRALSVLWPEVVPYHPNWKSDKTHEAYWTHTASLEHIDAVAVGGAEAEGNWITTSMARNQVRSRYSLEALGWKVQPRCSTNEWDGGLKAFLELLDRYPELLNSRHGAYFKQWRRFALEVS